MTERQAIQAVTLSDGRTLRLVCDPNALCDFDRVMTAAGFNPMRELQAFDAGTGAVFSVTRALFWAFAQEHHPELTLRDCGTILGREGRVISEAIAATMEQSMPDAAEVPTSPGPDTRGKTRPRKG